MSFHWLSRKESIACMHRCTRVLTWIIMHYPQWPVDLVAAFGFGLGGLQHNTYFILSLSVYLFCFSLHFIKLFVPWRHFKWGRPQRFFELHVSVNNHNFPCIPWTRLVLTDDIKLKINTCKPFRKCKRQTRSQVKASHHGRLTAGDLNHPRGAALQ